MKPQEETIRVKYIGPYSPWRDKTSLYGSGLTFEKGQVREVPLSLGKNFLRHLDLFVRAQEPKAGTAKTIEDDTAELLEQAKEEKEHRELEILERMDLMARIDQMDKVALSQFAKINYRQSLKMTEKVADLREQVRGMINQFGIVGGL